MLLEDVAADKAVELQERFVRKAVLALTAHDLKIGEGNRHALPLDEVFGED